MLALCWPAPPVYLTPQRADQIVVSYGERSRIVRTNGSAGPVRDLLRDPVAEGDWVELFSRTYNDWVPALLASPDPEPSGFGNPTGYGPFL
jgi:hypothetical protein